MSRCNAHLSVDACACCGINYCTPDMAAYHVSRSKLRTLTAQSFGLSSGRETFAG